MHCHLDFMQNGEQVAADAASAGTLLFANTVTPEGWQAARERFADFNNVFVGFGMHPWWVSESAGRLDDAYVARQASSQRAEHKRLVAQQEAQISAQGDARVKSEHPSRDNTGSSHETTRPESVVALLAEHDPVLIGEIGLDFGWRHAASREMQTTMFESIASWSAERGGKLLSLHSIKAAGETLDVLERSGALEACTCVFHWFSGASDQLKRAVDAGCYFSCGPRMLATKRGREYVKAIPAPRLLLETDAPPEQGQVYSYEELRRGLEDVATSVAAIKGPESLETISQTAQALLTSYLRPLA